MSGGESDELVRQVISFSTPPLTIGKNPQLPTVPKPLEIPGRPFPVLPDAPLRSRHAATSPIPKEKRAKPPPIDHVRNVRVMSRVNKHCIENLNRLTLQILSDNNRS